MSTRAEGRIWTVFRRLARDERSSRIKNRRHASEKMLLWIKRNLPLRRTPERKIPFLGTNTPKNCVAKQRISLGSVQTVIDNNLITALLRL